MVATIVEDVVVSEIPVVEKQDWTKLEVEAKDLLSFYTWLSNQDQTTEFYGADAYSCPIGRWLQHLSGMRSWYGIYNGSFDDDDQHKLKGVKWQEDVAVYARDIAWEKGEPVTVAQVMQFCNNRWTAWSEIVNGDAVGMMPAGS